MSKNYLELQHSFPELVAETDSSFTAAPSEITEELEADLQLKPGFEENEQTV
ncbi:MAG: hypothetical protein WD469_06160 [Paenibacillaceae bacterium]